MLFNYFTSKIESYCKEINRYRLYRESKKEKLSGARLQEHPAPDICPPYFQRVALQQAVYGATEEFVHSQYHGHDRVRHFHFVTAGR